MTSFHVRVECQRDYARHPERQNIAWRIRGPPVQTLRPRTVRRIAASFIRIPAANSVSLVPDSAAPIPFTLRVPRSAPTSALESAVPASESRASRGGRPSTLPLRDRPFRSTIFPGLPSIAPRRELGAPGTGTADIQPISVRLRLSRLLVGAAVQRRSAR